MVRTAAGLLLLGAALVAAPAAAGPEGSETKTGAEAGEATGSEGRARRDFSSYEVETIELVLEDVGGKIDPAPEGKRIESVEVVTLDFLEERDPLPTFFNAFHATTRPHIVERELLIGEGEEWRWDLVDESERNLRTFRQFSVVLLLPVKGRDENHVRLLVVTKDVLSLRLNWDVAIVDGQLALLVLQPSEENLFGRHKSVQATMTYEPDTVSLGFGYSDRRLWGSRVTWGGVAGIIVNHGTGESEGSFGSLSFFKPLYSTRTRWGWGSVVAWRNEVTRRFVGIRPAVYFAREEPEAPLAVSTPDGRATPEPWIRELGFERGPLPFEWKTGIVNWQTFITRSYGIKNKTNLEWGLESVRRRFSVHRLRQFDPNVVRAFQDDQVPTANVRIGPFFEINAFSTRFLRTLDFERLGLQEDFRLGHRASMKVYTGSKRAHGTRDLIGLYNGLSYSFPLGDGLFRLYGSNRIELASSIEDSDGQVEAGLRLVTPTFGFGRFVYDGGVLHRYRDHLNLRFAVGGDGRLRGYKANAPFLGKDVAASNLEFRTRGITIPVLKFQAGLAAFWDAAHAADGFENLELRHGLGFGIRGLFPQLDNMVGRLDVAFPLSEFTAAESNGFSVVFTFGQAFDVPQVSPSGPVLAR